MSILFYHYKESFEFMKEVEAIGAKVNAKEDMKMLYGREESKRMKEIATK